MERVHLLSSLVLGPDDALTDAVVYDGAEQKSDGVRRRV